MKFRFVLLGPEDDPDRHPARQGAPTVPSSPSGALRYEQRGTDLIRREQLPNGRWKCIAVANFTARIVSDIILEDGTDGEKRAFGVEAELGGRRLAFVLPAGEFGRMGWVLPKLGPQAIIYPGQQQHARAAIQWLSGPIRQERIFAHLGWRKHGPHWVYLHAAGAMGADGPLSGLQVQLPAALQHYQVRSAEDPAGLVRAVRASMRFLSVAPDRISFPLLAAVYRAALGGVNFSLFLTGQSGVFKTALAALCQQHFGAAMEASNLPANFSATGNALEGLAFSAKDALLVVDDFAPTGRHGDGALQGVAERLFRAAGNHQGRSRMGGDGRLRAPQPSGWEIFLQFALSIGALGRAEQEELEERSGRALCELAALQAPYQEASDPALRFVALLRAALAGGRAHVADRGGRAPAEAAAWGWQRQGRGRGWAPRGTRIGWVAGSDLFLEPAGSYQVAQELAGAERIPVGEQTLRRRLRERGLLASIDAGRQTLPVRRTLEGGPRQVLHLKSSELVGWAAVESGRRSRRKDGINR